MYLDNYITAKYNEMVIQPSPVYMDAENELQHEQATTCVFCSKPLGEERELEYNHFNYEYVGAAHKLCNKYASNTTKIPLIPLYFHNMNYDLKHFLHNIGYQGLNASCLSNVTVIPCNMEQFKSVRINNIVISDSYSHLPSKLDTLITNLPDYKKKHLREIAIDYSGIIYTKISGDTNWPKHNTLK